MLLDDKILALLKKNRKLLIKLLAVPPKSVKTFSEAEKKALEVQLLKEREEQRLAGRTPPRHPSSFTKGEWEAQQKKVEQLKADRRMNYLLDCWHPPPKQKGKKQRKSTISDEDLLKFFLQNPAMREHILKALEKGDA